MTKEKMLYEDFQRLKSKWGEYDCTLPTGTTPGKKWFHREPYGADDIEATWYIGEYGNPSDGTIPITWTRIEIDWPNHLLERLGK